MQQTPLPLGNTLEPSCRFANFIVGRNLQLMQRLQQTSPPPLLYLWGGDGLGKSHLLQSICHAQSDQGGVAFYLPLALLKDEDPSLLTGMGEANLIALDDLDSVAGRADWEEAIFHLLNQLRLQGGRGVVAARHAPQALPLQLPDLSSRLQWGEVYSLQPLNDAEKHRLLQDRARSYGIHLSDALVNYLMQRLTREVGPLMRLLEDLDYASLAAKQRVTIPFVRQWLQQQNRLV
ncbi:MAG: DnaA regulatory inactivator Hda [Gammaproteobacteria bacterium]|nr:DnaA regulatory inactivator Hda [Gammaproteobacteria bacterium]